MHIIYVRDSDKNIIDEYKRLNHTKIYLLYIYLQQQTLYYIYIKEKVITPPGPDELFQNLSLPPATHDKFYRKKN